ncbi:MAG TPA: head GIN domain-containing protein [Cyclobacteriaceae bacterium]|nr:head GIN domain-containing protein [Cyclobacteriaceae bacterium]
MRTIATLALAVLMISNVSFAQSKETRDVSTFREISYRTSGKLYLRQGSPQKVVLEGNEEAIREVETYLKGDRLIIENRDNNRWFSWGNDSRDKINIYITVENIDAIYLSGSGDLLAENAIQSENMDLRVSGSGSMELQVDLNGDLEANVSGSGDLRVKGNCRNLDSSVSGSGKVYIANAIEGTAKFGLSGSGKVLAAGRAKVVKASVSGSGKLLAQDLVTDRCEVNITGSGDVEINVKSELDARITGSGSVRYKGSPNHVNNHSTGSGKIRKIEG